MIEIKTQLWEGQGKEVNSAQQSAVCILRVFLVDFFFQAEDGIRDRNVTGVQTCALPIYYLQSKEDIQSILSGISGGMKEQLVAGLSGSARSLLISILNESIKKPILII